MIALQRGKILIVDDDEIVRVALERELSEEGYEVQVAESGQEAVELARNESFDIVYTDLVMPDMNGIKVCKQIKRLSEDTEVILISGHPKEIVEHQVDFVDAGGRDKILRKPLGSGELAHTTRELIAEIRRRKDTNKMSPEQILVIDDDEIVREVVSRELSEGGYEVDTASSGEEAVEKVKFKQYNLVFVDWKLPVMDGVATCREIKKLRPKAELVFFTGNLNPELIRQEVAFMEAGGKVYFLYKPFVEGELLRTARSVLSWNRGSSSAS